VNGEITRRQLIERAAAGSALLSFPSFLAACGGGDELEQGATTPATTTVKKELADSLRFSNWELYVDVSEDGKRRPTLEQFEKQFGVKVEYFEDINDNEEYFGKVQAPLSAGQSIDRDLMVLTDWMAARMIRLGYVQKKDKSAIPNESNLADALQSPAWDANREYSLPWQSGLTGIGYDPKRTGRKLTTIDDLFDPKFKGHVTFLTEMPDTMGLLLLNQGADPTKVDPGAFDDAIARLQDGVDSGQIRQFTGNEYAQMLEKGDVWACTAWSGDMVQLKFSKPSLEFVIPEEGGMIWTDNMLIPLGGDVYTASVFMNYVYDPKVQAEIEAWVNYICPVEGAQEAIKEIDPELAANELIFPSEDTLSQVHIFDAEAADTTELKEKFQAVIGA
jgi:spermidine/putrescine transport system substrate-binding protein